MNDGLNKLAEIVRSQGGYDFAAVEEYRRCCDCKPLVWSKALPTEPGFYLARCWAGKRMFEFRPYPDGEGLYFDDGDDDGATPTALLEGDGWVFAGPIPEPKEPA